MDGREATRRIRQQPRFAGLPIIASSASATSEDEAQCRAAGADVFLPKPIDNDLLLKTIGDLLSLTWITAGERVPAAADAEPGQAAGVVVPPPDEIETLYRLARVGNMGSLRARADYLQDLDPRYAAFAGQLRSLAESYQSKAILALVARYRAAHDAVRTEDPQK
jgi:CheY-like chemotaxis protein